MFLNQQSLQIKIEVTFHGGLRLIKKYFDFKCSTVIYAHE